MKGYQLAVAIIAFALVGSFCLRPPALPQWDVEVSVPLYHGQLRLSDLLDTARFRVQSDSSIQLLLDLPFDSVRPDGALDLVGIDEENRIEVSDFVLTDVGRSRTRFDLSEIVAVPIPDTGMKARLEPFESRCSHEVAVEGVASAEIVEGVLAVKATNYTRLQFDSLWVESPLGTVRFGRLDPGASDQARLDLGGVVATSPVPITLVAGSPGTGPDTVVLRKDDSVTVEYVLDSLRIASGRLRLPATSAGRRCPVRLTSAKPMRIDSLELLAGRCSFTMANGFSVPMQVHFSAPRLNAVSDRSVGAEATTALDLDLNGLVIDNRGRTNSLFEFYVSAATSATDSFVDIAKDDGISVFHSATGLKPRVVCGMFRQPVYVATRAGHASMRLPGGFDGLRMTSVELGLELENGVGFPMEVVLELTARRGGVRLAGIERTLPLQSALAGVGYRGAWTIPVTELVNTGPEEIVYAYTTRILGEGRFESGSYITGGATICAPLRLAMVADTVATGARRIPLRDADRARVAKHLVGGAADLTVTNHLPFGLDGRVVLALEPGAERSSETSVDSVVLPFSIGPGRVDLKGNCVADAESRIEAELDSAAVSLFKSWPLCGRVVFEVPRTDTVTLRAGDRAGVAALLRLRVRVEE